jgi:hypothetical protein
MLLAMVSAHGLSNQETLDTQTFYSFADNVRVFEMRVKRERTNPY